VHAETCTHPGCQDRCGGCAPVGDHLHHRRFVSPEWQPARCGCSGFCSFSPCRRCQHLAPRGLHLGLDEHLRVVAIIERAHHFASKLQVRRLVNANRHNIRFIQDDIRRHQHRITHQAVVHIVRLLARFLLKCRQIVSLPSGVIMRGWRGSSVTEDMRLDKNDRFLWPDACGQEIQRHV